MDQVNAQALMQMFIGMPEKEREDFRLMLTGYSMQPASAAPKAAKKTRSKKAPKVEAASAS